MYKRTLARELVLQALYRLDLTDGSPEECLGDVLASRGVEAQTRSYAERLFHGVVEKMRELDCIIEKHSAHWTIERMSVVDRNILRIGAYEILYVEDVPFKVAIDEAVELAKRFSTRDSGAFINGILDSLAKSPSAGKNRGLSQGRLAPLT
ncbi:MAG TPA: transcription antitermination factor NusB [Deltaproteobacteria bacterium]|nr:transcription antitermination factor NusB [Deltaproteobacteria bacterium]